MSYNNDGNSQGGTYYVDENGNSRYSGYGYQSGGYYGGWTQPHEQQPNSTPTDPNWQNTVYRPYQQPQISPYPATPPETPPEVAISEPEKKSKIGGKYIALLLAVSVISGAAGGGINYTFMNNATSSANTGVSTETLDTPLISSEAETQSNVSNNSETTVSIAQSDIAGVVAKASDSVVEISVKTVSGNSFFGEYVTEGSGSGVVLTDDGYITTNDHVIESAQTITVRTKNGEEYQARLIGTDSKTDLAVLKIDATGLNAASFADSDQIRVGELAVAIGNPLGTLGGTVTDGIISAKDREINIGGETMVLLQTSAAVNPGNSGGGLFNANGDLVGVINAKSAGSGVEGLGFAIPSNLVNTVTAELISNGYVSGRPQLGIMVRSITDVRTAWMYGVDEPGIYVVSAIDDSPLQINDKLVKVDGVEISELTDVKRAIENKNVGDTVEIVVRRDGQQVTIQAPLFEQTPASGQIPQTQESDI